MSLYKTPLASGGELLVERATAYEEATQGRHLRFDVVIIGSGYGGSVAAARLTEDIGNASGEQLSVCVLERGLEYLPGRFPNRFADLPGHVRVNRFDTPELTGDAAGLFDLRIGEDVSVLLGSGLGGGSLINASVAEEPDPRVFQCWPKDLRAPDALKDHFATARRMLGAGPARIKGLRKYREFKAWAEGVGIPARPATVAVTFTQGDNGHGVEQHACINCGDCFTGCNYHAKNTLPMNYLARAKRNGACLYTGVTVSHLAQADSDWAVCFNLTPRPGAPGWQRAPHCVLAGHVILAAGALGSTEILMRSKAAGLQVSSTLGTRFSCNGDMIGGLYAQDCYVNATAPESSPPAERNVGPTITGIARKDGEGNQRLVLEELAIPASLRRIFEEVATTAALPYRLGSFESPLSFRNRVDPVAVDPDAIDRSQVFAAMGEDLAAGELEMIPGWDSDNRKVADGVVAVKWPDAARDPLYDFQDRCMARPTTNGGEYLRSPLWQPLPKEFGEQLAGKKPAGKLLTVHPLGGCPMADDPESGVVNHIGQVFRVPGGKDDVYKNLLVLDGSIVPTALGINPLLTITALAERAIALCIDRNLQSGFWRRGSEEPASSPPALPQVASDSFVHWAVRRVGRALGVYALADCFVQRPSQRWSEEQRPSALRFAERVRGDVQLGSVYEAQLTLHFKAVEDVPGFLRNRSRELRIGRGELELTRQGSKDSRRVEVSGTVVLLEPCDDLSAFQRTSVALDAFLRLRGIADRLQSRREERGDSTASPSDKRLGRVLLWATPILAFLAGLAAPFGCLLWPLWLLLRRFAGRVVDWITRAIRKWLPWLVFVPLAYQIGEARRLRYRLTLDQDLLLDNECLPQGTSIEGEKILRYTLEGNPWWQLFQLPIAIRRPGSDEVTKASLNVDLDYFFRRYATQLQITHQRDLPSGLIDVFSTLLFLLRIVTKVHFWSFRLPEYQKHDPELMKHRTPGKLPVLEYEPHDVDTPRDAPQLLLTHYWDKQKVAGIPVVLFHGLGASGNQFATNKLDTNLVRYLAEKGRDVWVAELRHSIALESSQQQWTLDAIALGDVPRIITKVRELTRASKVDVVAHCIGSAMFCTAALAGKLQENNESAIHAAVLMQVGPLITLSPGTKIRAYLAAFLRRYMRESFVDFSVDDQADWIDSLVDRILATYPYPASEARHHRLEPPWEPHLHLANCNRWAAIDGRMLQHKNLDQTMLHSLGEILGHANLMTWEQTIQYAYMERLTDYEARNYVTEDNIKKYFRFPVRFIHGRENDVFDVRTSRRSWQLLKQVIGPNHRCDMKVIPGYSHLDPLIGKDAHADVYLHISEFLSGGSAIEPLSVPALPEIRRPLIGPVLGWTRRNGAGEWTARVWCRVDDTRSPCSYVLVIPRKDGKPLYHRIKGVWPYAGRIDTLAVFDVDLEVENADYDIIVVSVHLPGTKPTLKDPKWESLAPPEIELKLSEDEIDRRIREAETLWRAGRDGCTTDPGYDQPLYSAVLKKRVLEQNVGNNGIRFALASCRYGGSVIDRERADALFGRLRTLVEDDEQTDVPSLLLLVGDQIYADQTAGVFDARGRRDRFYEAYREAWTAPNARAVLSRLPTYMMMDDHEIGDNWHPEDDRGADEAKLRLQGIEAFQEYQLLHSPRHDQLSAARLSQGWPPRGFGYEFSAAGFPFFVFDTRSGRERADRIMKEEQMRRFKDWLAACDKDRPKFVVSPSVVVPYYIDSGPEHAYASRSDAWDGYTDSLRDVFRAIWETKANNVVFLCGDAHLSMASGIWFIDGNADPQGDLRAYCVVSSGLYAPFPFANSKEHEYLRANGGSRRLELQPGIYMHYQVLPDSWMPEDNFTIVDVAPVDGAWKVSLREYDLAGKVRAVELSAARLSAAEVQAATVVEQERCVEFENRITG